MIYSIKMEYNMKLTAYSVKLKKVGDCKPTDSNNEKW